MNNIIVIGGGFAGVEAAHQLSKAGFKVSLYEMKPHRFSPAHTKETLAELVCSNSFKALRTASAAGTLKAEMEFFDSICVRCAKATAVPAGGALAVDRDKFSEMVTKEIEADSNITLIRQELTEIPKDAYVVVAAGPLASDAIAEHIDKLCPGHLSFFDAAAPIVTAESLDMQSAFSQSRYERGGDDDYINCPLNKEEYEHFYDELVNAQSAPTHSFDKRKGVYEGCMPIEVMAARGHDTIRFGPMKPVGLRDPKTGHRPWAVLQLRKENADGSLYNLVGFQTNLKFGEQKRVFSMIPALRNAEFVRYGVMHRNTFINSPKLLDADFSLRSNHNIYFAGQITGVEGYMESASAGILAGLNLARRLKGEAPLILPQDTMMGALSRYISDETVENFQPMGANFGILPPLPEKIKNKQERYEQISKRALASLEAFLNDKEVL